MSEKMTQEIEVKLTGNVEGLVGSMAAAKAAMMGMSDNSATKAMADSMKQVGKSMSAISRQMSKDIMTATEKYSKSFNTLSEVYLDLDGQMEGLQKEVDETTESLKYQADVVGATGKELSQYVTEALKARLALKENELIMNQLFDEMANATRTFKDFMIETHNLKIELEGAAQSTAELTNEITELMSKDMNFRDIFNTSDVHAGLKNVEAVLNGISTGARAAVQSIRQIPDNIEGAFLSMANTFGAVAQSMPAYFTSAVERIKAGFESLKVTAINTGKTITAVLLNPVAAIKGLGRAFLSVSSAIKGGVVSSAKAAIPKIKELGNKLNEASSKKVSKGFGAIGGMIKGIVATAAIAGIAKLVKSSATLASAMEENENVVSSVFNDALPSGVKSALVDIENFSKTTLNSFGVSELAAKQFIGTMSSMLNSLGVAPAKIAPMSKALTSLAGDMASFYNINVEDAMSKLTSGMSGETEPLKRLGITLTDASLSAHMASLGINETFSSLSEASKAAVRYSFIMQNTTAMQGDFARTQHTYANQVRLLKENLDELKILIGKGMTGAFGGWLVQINTVIKGLKHMVATLYGLLGFKVPESSLVNNDFTDAAKSTASVADNLNKGADAAKATAKAFKGMAGIDAINNIGSDSESSDSGSSSGAGGIDIEIPTPDYKNVDVATTEISDKIKKKMEAVAGFLAAPFKWIGEQFQKVKAWYSENSDLFDRVWQKLGDVITAVGKRLSPVFEAIGKAIGFVVVLVAKIIDAIPPEVWEFIATAVLAVAAAFLIFKGVILAINVVMAIFNAIMMASPLTWIVIAIVAVIAAIILMIVYWDEIIAVIGKVWGVVKSAFSAYWEMIKSVFDGIVSIISGVWEFIKGIFTGFITIMLTPFMAVITLVKDIFQNEDGVRGIFKAFLNFFINIFAGVWSAIQNSVKGALALFSGIWEGIKSIFGGVAKFFGDVFKKAWEGVKAVFTVGGKVFDGIKEGILSVFKTVVNGLIGGINLILATPFKAINGMLNIIRDVGLMGMKPFSWIKKDFLPIPQIPKLAKGGVVDSATMFIAGEQGREVVMPLENNTGWMQTVAEGISRNMGGNSEPKNDRPVIVNLMLDRTKLGTVTIDSLNELKKRGGTIPINL